MKKIEKKLHKLIQKYRESIIFRTPYLIAKKYVYAYNHAGFEQEINGEFMVIERIAPLLPKQATVFDVGFNHGDWTKKVLEEIPKAKIHGFEAVKKTFEKIDSDLRKKATVNNVGLADQEKVVTFFFSERYDGRTSMIKKPAEGFKPIKIPVTTGDKYCKKNAIEHIDLVKIDVEGAEHLVLNGFKDTFEKSAPLAIQFEYHNTNINTHFLLIDFYNSLSENYVIGKIFPRGVLFKDYERSDEDFVGPNYLAVRKDQHKIIDALSYH